MKNVEHTTSETVKKLKSDLFENTLGWNIVKRCLELHVALEIFILDSSTNNTGW